MAEGKMKLLNANFALFVCRVWKFMVVLSTILKHNISYFHFPGSSLFLWELYFAVASEQTKSILKCIKLWVLRGENKNVCRKKLSEKQYLHNTRVQTTCLASYLCIMHHLHRS